MKSSEGKIGRIFVLRLEDGDVIPDCIEAFAVENGLWSGLCLLVGGIGGGKLVVGPEKGDQRPVTTLLHILEGVHEAAAIGTIFPSEDGSPRLHMHAALGRDGNTRTGCVRQGIQVWQICEAVIIEIEGAGMMRKLDRETGFHVLAME